MAGCTVFLTVAAVFLSLVQVLRSLAVATVVAAVCNVAYCSTWCAPADTVQAVTIAKKSHVCVVFNGVARTYFTPTADTLTRLEFYGSTCP